MNVCTLESSFQSITINCKYGVQNWRTAVINLPSVIIRQNFLDFVKCPLYKPKTFLYSVTGESSMISIYYRSECYPFNMWGPLTSSCPVWRYGVDGLAMSPGVSRLTGLYCGWWAYLHMKRVTAEGECCRLPDNLCKSRRLGEQKRGLERIYDAYSLSNTLSFNPNGDY